MAPLLIAHRGASYDAPENTLAAFRLAWEQGADGIEGDFHLSGDGQIVCIHDAGTGRVAGRDLPVAQATLAELRRLDVGSWKGQQWSGQRIPTFGEVLAQLPAGKRLLLEIKCGPQIVAPLAEALAAGGGLQQQVTVISFGDQVILECKRQLPQLKALLLTAFKQDAGAAAGRGLWRPTAGELADRARNCHADGVDVQAHAVVDEPFVAEFHRKNLELHTWVVDDIAGARRFARLGVDSITSNRPGLLCGCWQ